MIGKGKVIIYQEEMELWITSTVFVNSDGTIDYVYSFWIPHYVGEVIL